MAQNGSIAFILLKMSFEEPLGELAAVAPVAQVRLPTLAFVIQRNLLFSQCVISVLLLVDDHWPPPLAGTGSFENISEVALIS